MAATDGALPSPRKKKILHAAAQLFARRGYDATGIAELSEAVGLGRGALYHHIGSKEQLLYEISRERPVQMVDFGTELLEQDLDAEQKLRLLSRKMMETLASNLAGATVFLADSRALTGEHHEEIVKLRNEFEKIWTAILAQGVQESRFLPTHPLLTKGASSASSTTPTSG